MVFGIVGCDNRTALQKCVDENEGSITASWEEHAMNENTGCTKYQRNEELLNDMECYLLARAELNRKKVTRHCMDVLNGLKDKDYKLPGT